MSQISLPAVVRAVAWWVVLPTSRPRKISVILRTFGGLWLWCEVTGRFTNLVARLPLALDRASMSDGLWTVTGPGDDTAGDHCLLAGGIEAVCGAGRLLTLLVLPGFGVTV